MKLLDLFLEDLQLLASSNRVGLTAAVGILDRVA